MIRIAPDHQYARVFTNAWHGLAIAWLGLPMDAEVILASNLARAPHWTVDASLCMMKIAKTRAYSVSKKGCAMPAAITLFAPLTETASCTWNASRFLTPSASNQTHVPKKANVS